MSVAMATGSAGLIGSEAVHFLVVQGFPVGVPTRPSVSRPGDR